MCHNSYEAKTKRIYYQNIIQLSEKKRAGIKNVFLSVGKIKSTFIINENTCISFLVFIIIIIHAFFFIRIYNFTEYFEREKFKEMLKSSKMFATTARVRRI